MKAIKIKMLLIIGIIIISMLLPMNVVEAAGGFSISKGSASLTTGGTTTIIVTASNCAGQFTISSSNSSVATVNTSSVWLDNSSATITVTAKSAGTANISIKAVDVTDTDLNDITGTKTCSVTVTNPAPPPSTNPGGTTTGNGAGNTGTSNNKPSSVGSTNSSSSNNKPSSGTTTTTKPEEEKKSNDSTLKSLAIEGYELYPAFAPNTREYNLRVTNDITTVKVIPEVNDSKASYRVEGAKEALLVGKNVLTVVVVAEDGSSSNYVINITRAREGLNVEYIKIFYTDEAGEKQELALTPVFSAEVSEYDLGTISHMVSKLDVDVLANFKEAKIEIKGNEDLVEGENTIVITVTMPSESEEEADEVLTYTIKVEKQAEPVITFMGRIKNWFNGVIGTVSTWYGENIYEILMGALILCSFALGGLSVYLVFAYKKYKLILQRIAELTRISNAGVVNVPVGEAKTENSQNLTENIDLDLEEKRKGRHF